MGTGFLPVSPRETGGAEKYVHYLSDTLQKLGHQVTVIDIPGNLGTHGSYRRIEAPLRWRHNSNLVAHALRGLVFGRAAALRLQHLILRGEVDLVNFHGQFTSATGMPVARRHSIPTVFTMHNPLWSDPAACQSRVQRAKFWLEHRAEGMADAVIGLNQMVTNNRTLYFGLGAAKTTVAPVGVDDFWFESRPVSSLVRTRYSPDGERLIVVVGRMAPYKNQLVLARALPRILLEAPNIRLVFVGPHDSSPYLRRVQAALTEAHVEARTIFAGAVPLEELVQIYSLAEIFVLPSLRENCPQALLEAMAQGKAIVASNIPPLRELLPKGTAELVSPSDPDALARTLIRLLRDDRKREELQVQARRRAHDVHSWPRVASRVIEAYYKLARGSTTALAEVTGADP